MNIWPSTNRFTFLINKKKAKKTSLTVWSIKLRIDFTRKRHERNGTIFRWRFHHHYYDNCYISMHRRQCPPSWAALSCHLLSCFTFEGHPWNRQRERRTFFKNVSLCVCVFFVCDFFFAAFLRLPVGFAFFSLVLFFSYFALCARISENLWRSFFSRLFSIS